MAKNIAIIFAGGTGTRMGNQSKPKQFLNVNGKPILVHTMEIFQKSPVIDEMYLACIEDWIPYAKELTTTYGLTKVKDIFPGGATGQDSIYIALNKAKENNSEDTVVLIHDGVRPFITQQLIVDCINSVTEYGSAITCTPCYETIIISEDGSSIKEVPFRKETYAGQAPQGFKLGEIIQLHEIERERNPEYVDIVDSCTLYRVNGKNVHLVEGNRGNIKITTPEDYFLFKALLEYKENEDVLGLSLLNKKVK